MIIGVDGGATIAIAALDYQGRVVALESRKHWPRNDLVAFITALKPDWIASDTQPAGTLAQELAHAFPARVYAPAQSLTQEEKHELTRDRNVRTENAHERDALAAAISAYRAQANKLRQTAKHAEQAGADVIAAQQGVLRGLRMDEALKPPTTPAPTRPEPRPIRQRQPVTRTWIEKGAGDAAKPPRFWVVRDSNRTGTAGINRTPSPTRTSRGADAPPSTEMSNVTEENTVYVGKKPATSYVMAVLTQFNNGASEVNLKARGMAISRAADVTQILKNRFLASMVIAGINIYTEDVENPDGGTSKVTTMHFVLRK